MKVLLLLNGPNGCQTGIEDGFSHLLSNNKIQALKWVYFNDHINQYGAQAGLNMILSLAIDFQPDLVFLFHVGKAPITEEFILDIKKIKSKPTFVYDEGDMYGGFSKPLNSQTKMAMRLADAVSIRGLGKFHESVSRLNKNTFYTPHHADIARFDSEPHILRDRDNDLVLIGNRIRSKLLPFIPRLSGAKGREDFVRAIGDEFPNNFRLYGNGWSGFKGNQGPLDFYKQMDVYRNSWITVAYEHYPEIPHYFSNRLPIALLSGSLYVCHWHPGYDSQFKECDFIYFFHSNREAVDLVKYILSRNKESLLEMSFKAREHAVKNYLPSVVWSCFLENVLAIKNEK